MYIDIHNILCYLIGVRVILCDFWSDVYQVGLWEGSLNRTFPVHTLLCLYVRSFLGTLYPLRAYFMEGLPSSARKVALLHGSPSIVAWLQDDRVCGMADE